MKILNLLVYFLIFLFFYSCNQLTENSQEANEIKDTMLSEETSLVSLDSLTIRYWKATDANEYFFKYSNGDIQISSQYSSLNKTIARDITIRKFNSYIDTLFIYNNKEIELSRLKRKESIVTDYSVITIKGYRDKQEIINQKIQIGEENYKVKFNPKFIEFVELLDELILEK